MGDKNLRRREKVDLDQVRVTRWWRKCGGGKGKKKGSKNWTRRRKRMKEVRLGSSEGQGIFFVKVHMSGWQAARGIQPKNLFNVCFTG